MDDEALVETIVSDGAQLEARLQRDLRLPGGSTIAARDVEANDWNLLVVLPKDLSRLHFYEVLQDYLQNLELSVPLDRIVLVKETDPGLRELRGAAAPWMSHRSWATAPIEVAGRLFADPLRVRIEPRVFEDQVAAAIQAGLEAVEIVAPRDVQRLGWDDLAHRGLPVIVDFVLRYQDSLVMIETKVSRRPLTHTPVLAALGQLAYAQRVTRQPVRLALVSMSGFSDRIEEALDVFPDVALLTWQPHDGSLALASSLKRFVNTPLPF